MIDEWLLPLLLDYASPSQLNAQLNGNLLDTVRDLVHGVIPALVLVLVNQTLRHGRRCEAESLLDAGILLLLLRRRRSGRLVRLTSTATRDRLEAVVGSGLDGVRFGPR
jgi:hypothetical protein